MKIEVAVLSSPSLIVLVVSLWTESNIEHDHREGISRDTGSIEQKAWGYFMTLVNCSGS